MGLIKTKDGRNVSVASKNGYTLQGVRKAKKYLDEIGHNRRNFPIDKLVEYYNDVKQANATASGCKPCQATRFYNGILNYYEYGKLTLVANGLATEEQIDNYEEPKEAQEDVKKDEVDKLSTEDEKVPQKAIKRAKKAKK